MSSINSLGRTINVITSVTTAARRVNLNHYSGVLFVVNGATGATTLTINEANAASGGTSQLLAGGTALTLPYWTMANNSGVWTAGAGGVNGTSINTLAAAGATLAVYVTQGMLSDGFTYVSASHATGTILYVLGDVNAGRRPTNLSDVTV